MVGEDIRFAKHQPLSHQEGPNVAHVRNTSLSQHLVYVKDCCSRCIEEHVELPIKEVCLQRGQQARFVDWPPTTNTLSAILSRTEQQSPQERERTHDETTE